MSKIQQSFRTKTYIRPRNPSMSQNFISVQKVINNYEKNKFHPKIQNFRYMSVKNITKNSPYKKLFMQKQHNNLSSEKIFGPIPQLFKLSNDLIYKNKKQEACQITLASSEQRETYIKLSKFRNKQKRRKLRQIYPKKIQKSLEKSKDHLMQLLACQKSYQTLEGKNENKIAPKRQIYTPQQIRKLSPSKSNLQSQDSYKKYNQLQIEQFLEQETELTVSQKKRITQFKNRQMNKNSLKNVRKSQHFLEKDFQKPLKRPITQACNDYCDQWPLNQSYKGWVVNYNNQSHLVTL